MTRLSSDGAPGWRIRLGREAEHDFRAILQWTIDTFGERQARTYGTTLVQAIAELSAGPDLLGSARRDEIGPGLRSIHVARHGRRGRHIILYRPIDPDLIEVVRLLHDQMEVSRHLVLPPD